MHPTSRSQLASLALPYVHITKENVDRVQQTLVSPYPASVTLTAESNDQAEMIQRNVESRFHAGGEKFVAIKRGSKLRIQPRLRSTALPLSKYAIDRPLEVVVTQGKWTCVIGYGFGWVGNAAIVYEDVRAVIPRQPVPLRSFSWVAQMSYNESDVPAVSSLISLMSPGIQSLHLARSRIKTEDLRLLLAHCPSLQHLEIPIHCVQSFDTFCNYSPGSLRSLNIPFRVSWDESTQNPPSANLPCLTAFRENPASHQLLTLVFDYNSDDHEQLERLLSAIKTHSTLEYLLPYQLLLSDEPPKHEVFDTLDGQTISILGPPRNTKLAFLSVIGRKLQTTSNAALHHLDVVLVSKIFAFSGTPVKRHVHREHQANMSLSRFAYW